MTASTWALVPVGLVIAGKQWESYCLRAKRARISTVIHINGTRGKTQTTKLLTYVLQTNGIHDIGKTTGDRPQLIDTDGTMISIQRRAPVSISEQAWTIRQAARRNADAVVVECMAMGTYKLLADRWLEDFYRDGIVAYPWLNESAGRLDPQLTINSFFSDKPIGD